jgi:hypothetical protein
MCVERTNYTFNALLLFASRLRKVFEELDAQFCPLVRMNFHGGSPFLNGKVLSIVPLFGDQQTYLVTYTQPADPSASMTALNSQVKLSQLRFNAYDHAVPVEVCILKSMTNVPNVYCLNSIYIYIYIYIYILRYRRVFWETNVDLGNETSLTAVSQNIRYRLSIACR